MKAKDVYFILRYENVILYKNFKNVLFYEDMKPFLDEKLRNIFFKFELDIWRHENVSTDLLSCKKHLMTRATISSSPCNIGHAHCRCRLCLAADPRIRTSLSCAQCHLQRRKALNSILPLDVRNGEWLDQHTEAIIGPTSIFGFQKKLVF